MLSQFFSFLNNECKYKEGHKVLVAFSGGADSLALLHLFKMNGINVSAAHCNFNLRGAESDADEAFVRDFCKINEVPLYVNSFDTKEYSKQKGISIEMAARDLRYDWFQELVHKYEFNWIATGHHQDDSVETFFLNLLRGTGVKGLTGINPVHGNIIRPLMAFSRKELEAYCNENKLSYRTDSSNLESVYTRNKIRNEIIPLFQSLNPSFSDTMLKNMDRLQQISDFVTASIEDIKQDWVVEQDDTVLISLKHVNEFKEKHLVLFELLHPYGFNGAVIDDIIETINMNASGKQFYSSSHRLIKDRQNLIVLPIKEDVSKNYYVSFDEDHIKIPIDINIERGISSESFKIDRSLLVAQFDEELLEYPLTICKWEQGDSFRPLGMKNFKKISDFFIDNKFSIQEKENCWLMLSGDDIIWIIGHRTDDRYKITSKTKKITKFTMKR